MRNVDWSETLSVGVDEVDEDHRKLVDLFNLFAQAVADDKDPNYLEALLEELIACTVWHFRHEERLMLKYNYQGFDEHKVDHQDLTEAVGVLKQKFLDRGKQVTEEDIEYLEQWLVEHILVTDMPMGSYLSEVM